MFGPLGERFIFFSHYWLFLQVLWVLGIDAVIWVLFWMVTYSRTMPYFFISCYFFAETINIVSCYNMSALIHFHVSVLKQADTTNRHYLALAAQSHNICSHLCFIIYNCNWPIFVMNNIMALTSSWLLMFYAFVSFDSWYLFVLCISLPILKRGLAFCCLDDC